MTASTALSDHNGEPKIHVFEDDGDKYYYGAITQDGAFKQHLADMSLDKDYDMYGFKVSYLECLPQDQVIADEDGNSKTAREWAIEWTSELPA